MQNDWLFGPAVEREKDTQAKSQPTSQEMPQRLIELMEQQNALLQAIRDLLQDQTASVHKTEGKSEA